VADSIRNIPRNPLLGKLSDALRSGYDYATEGSPVRSAVGEFLGAPSLLRTTERVASGEPLTKGRGMTLAMQPDVADTAMFASNFVAPGGKAVMATKGLPVGASTKLLPELPGTIKGTGYHYSKAPRSVLDSSAYGTGLRGSAFDDIRAAAAAGDPDALHRISLYVPKGGKVVPESGVGGIAHEVPFSNVYDTNANALRLDLGDQRKLEKTLRDKGYSGYLDRMEGTQPGQVIMLGKQKLPTKVLGPSSNLEGLTDLPAPVATPARGRDVQLEKLAALKDLPAGELSPASWGVMVKKRDPELHAALEPTGVFQPGGKSQYKDGLLKAIREATEAPNYDDLGAAAPTPLPGMSERAVATPKQVEVAKRYLTGDKKGIYRGSEAFGGITPQKMTTLRQGYMDKMAEGASARHWYDQSSADIHRWTGGDTAKSDQMANILAETSARTPVSSNLMYANKGWNQALRGENVKTGGFPTVMGKNIDRMLNNPEEAVQGLKRSPFSAGLSVNWRGADFASRPTHDIHDVRAWGITDPKTGGPWTKGVGDAGHRFLDTQAFDVTNKANQMKLGGADDWNPYRAQAAAWISQKAKTDGTPLADAARHYGTFAPDYQTQITREWAPGTNTGHFPEYHNLPDEAKQEYARVLEQNVVGREGIDKLGSDAGALMDRTLPNVGSYEGATEPGFISAMNVGKAPGSQEMDPASKAIADAIASAHGILGVQKQVAHNYAGGVVPVGKAGAVRFPGEFVGDEAMKAAATRLRELGADVPQRDLAGGLRVLSFGSPEEKVAQAKALRQFGTEFGAKPEFRAGSGSLIPEAAGDTWSAKPFVAAIEASGPKFEAQLSEAMKGPAAGVLRDSIALAEKYKMTDAPFFRTMLQGIAEGGLPRLKELIASGAVPAVFMSVGMDEVPELQ